MLNIEWVGTDGSTWDLVNGDVQLSNAGVMGLGMPTATDQVKITPGSHGQRFQSWKLNPREVFLPLIFNAASNADVEGIQRAFWHSMTIGEYGSLNVTDGNGYTRSLDLRFVDDGTLSYGLDPYSQRAPYKAFGVNMIADQPFWQGEEVSFSFSLGTGGTATFFGNGSNATPFYIVKSAGGEDAYVTNLGDMPSWVKWEITAPMTSFSLGIDGHYVAGDIALTTGQTLTIESDPLKQIAYKNDGTKVTRLLTSADFQSVPATGLPVLLEIDVVGTGTVTASFRPQFMRAF